LSLVFLKKQMSGPRPTPRAAAAAAAVVAVTFNTTKAKPMIASAKLTVDAVINVVTVSQKPIHVRPLALALVNGDAGKLIPPLYKDLRNILQQLRHEKRLYEDYQHRWCLWRTKTPQCQKNNSNPSTAVLNPETTKTAPVTAPADHVAAVAAAAAAAAVPQIPIQVAMANSNVIFSVTEGDDNASMCSLDVQIDPSDMGDASAMNKLADDQAGDQADDKQYYVPQVHIAEKDSFEFLQVNSGQDFFHSDVPPQNFLPNLPLFSQTHAQNVNAMMMGKMGAMSAMGANFGSVHPPPLPQNPPYVVTVIDAVSFAEALRIVQINCICVRRFIFTPPNLLVQPSSDVDMIDVIHPPPQLVELQQKHDMVDQKSRAKEMPTTAAFRVLSTLISFAQFNQYLPTTVVNIFSKDPLMHYIQRELVSFGFNVEIIDKVE